MKITVIVDEKCSFTNEEVVKAVLLFRAFSILSVISIYDIKIKCKK